MSEKKPTIEVHVSVKAPLEKVWKSWTTPADIIQWNNPSDGWHNLLVEVDLRDKGTFLFRMQAKDGSDGFDYCGLYDKVDTYKRIELTTQDGRKTINEFKPIGDETVIIETFEPEGATPIDVQKDFCQNVLNSFKSYVEKS